MRHLSLILTGSAAFGCTQQHVIPYGMTDPVAVGAAVRRVAPVGGSIGSAERALEGDGFRCTREEFGASVTRCARTSSLSLLGKERAWVITLGVSDGRVSRLAAEVRDIRR